MLVSDRAYEHLSFNLLMDQYQINTQYGIFGLLTKMAVSPQGTVQLMNFWFVTTGSWGVAHFDSYVAETLDLSWCTYGCLKNISYSSYF